MSSSWQKALAFRLTQTTGRKETLPLFYMNVPEKHGVYTRTETENNAEREEISWGWAKKQRIRCVQLAVRWLGVSSSLALLAANDTTQRKCRLSSVSSANYWRDVAGGLRRSGFSRGKRFPFSLFFQHTTPPSPQQLSLFHHCTDWWNHYLQPIDDPKLRFFLYTSTQNRSTVVFFCSSSKNIKPFIDGFWSLKSRYAFKRLEGLSGLKWALAINVTSRRSGASVWVHGIVFCEDPSSWSRILLDIHAKDPLLKTEFSSYLNGSFSQPWEHENSFHPLFQLYTWSYLLISFFFSYCFIVFLCFIYFKRESSIIRVVCCKAAPQTTSTNYTQHSLIFMCFFGIKKIHSRLKRRVVNWVLFRFPVYYDGRSCVFFLVIFSSSAQKWDWYNSPSRPHETT